jgi:uncharacterized protein (TIGR03435 family)
MFDRDKRRPSPAARITSGILAVLSLDVFSVQAQSRPQPPVTPTYDVSSVKINRTTDSSEAGLGFQRGRFLAKNATLLQIVRAVYGRDFLGADRIVGGPTWIDEVRYDVEAVTDGSLPPEQRQLAVQALLADRFHLVTHIEKQQRSTLDLTIANPEKMRAQMHRSNAVCAEASGPPPPPPAPRRGAAPPLPASSRGAPGAICGLRFAQGSIVGEAAAPWQLATALAGVADIRRIVTDVTGLDGRFDFALMWEPVQPAGVTGVTPPASTAGPSIFIALEEQLGLKLRPNNAMVDVLVIDRAEQPTSN